MWDPETDLGYFVEWEGLEHDDSGDLEEQEDLSHVLEGLNASLTEERRIPDDEIIRLPYCSAVPVGSDRMIRRIY